MKSVRPQFSSKAADLCANVGLFLFVSFFPPNFSALAINDFIIDVSARARPRALKKENQLFLAIISL